jgi:transposase InsO family protein
LPAEKEQVLAMARQEEYVDMSHRILTVTAWDQGLFFLSFSSTYRVLRSQGLSASRRGHRPHNGKSLAPVRKELTGPNQRWCWDISYLLTEEKGLFLYLYLLLDEYSRKALNWLVSWIQSAREAQELLDGGMLKENVLDLPEEDRPEVINDHGRQMKAKPVRRLFEEHHMPQLFARPRTPNDNPFIESSFSTAKRHPEYPGRFLDRETAAKYFTRYFAWYNNDHYHSGIKYVTPNQAHRGLMDEIVKARAAKLQRQRLLRKEANLISTMGLTETRNQRILSTRSAYLECN